MEAVEKIFVGLNISGKEFDVGELVVSQQKIYFRYNSEFISTGLNLSPIKLPFNNSIQSTDFEPFEGLFGVFDDSLPDSWGRLLFDRMLSSRGISLQNITPFDRLAYVGSTGMGALTYKPEIGSKQSDNFIIELDDIASEMNAILQGASTDVIEELFKLGGSSGGARPKVFVAYNPNTKSLSSDITNLPDGFENWIIKFPATSDNPEISKIEYAYYQMAANAGIKMSKCRLFQGKSGKVYFGTKRFDRIGNRRLHVHTAAGLMHDNYRSSQMDYGHLMDCAFRLEKHVDAYEKVFRLAAFNVFAHNRDDHSKNFSFLMNDKGEWEFAPAYDLTFSFSAFGFHSTLIAGESKNAGREHLLKLTKHFGLKNGKNIIDEVLEAISQWKTIAKEAGIGNENINLIQKHFNSIQF